MIKVYGTSHVSQESIDLIERKIEEEKPDIIALELDQLRLKTLINRKEDQTEAKNNLPIFLKLIKKFQNKIGSKTGVMPGQEMVFAYQKAAEKELEIALIDQDVRKTIGRLKTVHRREKVKAVLSMSLAYIMPQKKGIDVSKIPDEEMIGDLLNEMKARYPGLYRVLVEERNEVMVKALSQVQEENPEKKIIAFVGAAHEKEIKEKLEAKEFLNDTGDNYQSSLEHE